MVAQVLGPEAERRKLLKQFGLSDIYLTTLREVGPKEAKWRIEHEHAEMVKFSERRRDWLLLEYAVVQKPRPRQGRPDEPITPHSRDHDKRSGVRVG